MLAVAAAMIGNAQDALLSQPGAMPLQLTPAAAGMDHDRAASLVHRQQWVPHSSPFSTSGFAYDTRLKTSPDNDKTFRGGFGAGIAFLHDRAGAPELRTTDLQLDLAYHLPIDAYSSVGAGLQGGFRQQVMDAAQGQWGSQYDGQRYDASLPSGEQLQERRFRPDVGLGVVYSFRRMPQPMRHSNTLEVKAGMGIFHAARPDFSFAGEVDRLPRRYSAFVTPIIGIGRSDLQLRPAAYLNIQGTSSQLFAGLSVRKYFGEKGFVGEEERRPAIAIGAYSRNGEAAVALVEAEWGEYAIGISYDVPVRMLGPVAPYNAMEVSLRYRITRPEPGR
jgi:type IX secretion system PorP/SprF family membrane protein